MAGHNTFFPGFKASPAYIHSCLAFHSLVLASWSLSHVNSDPPFSWASSPNDNNKVILLTPNLMFGELSTDYNIVQAGNNVFTILNVRYWTMWHIYIYTNKS